MMENPWSKNMRTISFCAKMSMFTKKWLLKKVDFRERYNTLSCALSNFRLDENRSKKFALEWYFQKKRALTSQLAKNAIHEISLENALWEKSFFTTSGPLAKSQKSYWLSFALWAEFPATHPCYSWTKLGGPYPLKMYCLFSFMVPVITIQIIDFVGLFNDL